MVLLRVVTLKLMNDFACNGSFYFFLVSIDRSHVLRTTLRVYILTDIKGCFVIDCGKIIFYLFCLKNNDTELRTTFLR